MKLKEWEDKCVECNGSGIKDEEDLSLPYYCRRVCQTCQGSGKLSWLEKIFGKNSQLEVWLSPPAGFNRGKFRWGK